jgi:hypothetical protein
MSASSQGPFSSTPAQPDSPAEGGPAQPPKPRRLRALTVAVAVLVAVLLILAALVATGEFRFFGMPEPPTGSPSYPTFAQARSLSTAAANSSYGGGWGVVYAAGVNSRSTLVRPFIGDNGANYCEFLPLKGSKNVTIPAMKGNLSSGQSAAWTFVLRNSTDGILGVTVNDGIASIFGTGNDRCGLEWYAYSSAVLPASVMDSSQATATAYQAGGAAFLHSHPDANVTLQLEGNLTIGNSFSPAFWGVNFSSCAADSAAPNSSSLIGSSFDARVNALNGSLNGTMSVTGDCPVPLGLPLGGYPSIPLSSALAVGSTIDAVGLDSQLPDCASASCNFYNATLESVAPDLYAGNLSFAVTSSTGATISITGGVAIVGLTGQILGFYDFQTESWSPASAASLLLSTEDFLCLFDANVPTLVGDNLVATGSGAFSGTVTCPIT